MIKDKENHFLIKGQGIEDIIILSGLYNRASKYMKQKLIKQKEKDIKIQSCVVGFKIILNN